MALPLAYRWLLNEPAPKLLRAALADYGIREVPGQPSHPAILAWAKELGIPYKGDDVPWCGLAMAHWCKAAGYTPVAEPLRAKHWLAWGNVRKTAMLGDVLVFDRDGGGHVGVYCGESMSGDALLVLAGNQNNAVSIDWIERSRLVGVRRSPFRIAQPPNVRVIRLARLGHYSINEA